jgi:hypothetical protein
MTWKDVFTPPFKTDGYCNNRIYDSKGRFSLNSFVGKALTKTILQKLNGELSKMVHNGTFVYKNGYIVFEHNNEGKINVLLIRAWGRLTGTGGLNLRPDVAAKLQDDFAQWIVETLNN